MPALSGRPYVCLSDGLSAVLNEHMYVRLPFFLSDRKSVRLSDLLRVYRSVRPYTRPSVGLTVHLSV